MKKSLLLLVSVLFISLSGQSQSLNVSSEFQSKYHMLDSAELYVPRIAGKSFTPTAPPTGTIRAIAEWEPMQAVLVSYNAGFGIPYTLIAEMSQNTKLITIVESSSQQSTVTNNYNNNGVNMANCIFIIAPLDSYWSRDYGPWFIMVNNSEIAIIDFPYNRPSRINDDNVPIVMANYMNVNWYGMNVMHTGGNYMCDGMGIAAMTNLVEDENTSLSHAQIDTLFKQYMGITRNYITTDPLGDYIKHIDCWGKFLDVDKILIAQVPVSNAQYSEYEAMAAFWANETSSYGNPYEVYRVSEPNGQPYTNSLILNNKVLIPFTSNTTQNNAALAVYQQAMPGYNCIGFIGATSTPWQSTDALHCRAHEIADKNMLYVQHLPYWGPQPILSQYTVSANIYALSGTTILPDSVWLKYKVNNSSWTQVMMTHISGNQWSGAIPQQTAGDTIRYFIHASDQSPRSVTHPIIGQSDPHKFYITGVVPVEEKKMKEALVFPNPANDYIFVQMRDCNAPDANIKLMNAFGKEVLSIDKTDCCNKMIKIYTKDLAPGTYFISITSGNENLLKKVLVMH
ncbi:MAG: Peptidylarginine deiminase precursor [Bacteroidetes bacterium ADurb.Bin408]|nr:MAG: Peptidylarginine deiminase precursor [Bacteroidetes bacterium ADurb.Bin408]